MKRRLTFLIVTLSIFVLGYGARGSAQQPSAAALPAATGAPAVSQSAAASPAAAHQAVLSKYCYVCHNDRVKSGRPRVDRSRYLRAGEEQRVVGEGDPQARDRCHATRGNAASGQGDRRRPTAISGNSA